MKLLNNLKNWLKPKPAPPLDSVPVPAAPNLAKYLQIWQLLKKIPVQKMLPAVVSVSGVVFLAISGLIAWLVILCVFVLRLFKIVL